MAASIAPQRHRKSNTSAHCTATTWSFNRTSEASKGAGRPRASRSASFNRTSEASKVIERHPLRLVVGASIAPQRHRKCVNPAHLSLGTHASIAPQRHRKLTFTLSASMVSSFNRTSEASKAAYVDLAAGLGTELQSHLRGIESLLIRSKGTRRHRASIAPQRHRKVGAAVRSSGSGK